MWADSQTDGRTDGRTVASRHILQIIATYSAGLQYIYIYIYPMVT
jgi:hypothetical protein